ncbi:MAG: hypothetical protein RBT45_06415, partial [Acholeplasmataceae bacterium]|nr:hypothetical protein [Acholeplasmataceae bacterium]
KFYGSSNIYFDRIIWNPNSANYNLFVIETLDGQGNYVTQYNSYEASHNILRFTASDDGIQVVTLIDQPIGPDLEETVFYLFDNTTYRMYWAKSNIYTNSKVEDLPFTTGSPYKNGAYGTVEFEVDGSYLDMTVFYDNTYKMETKLIDDISMFMDVSFAYYWTDNNQKFISITYEDEEPVYLSSLPIQARPWANTVTWNLTTNEVRSTNKIEVFAYHDKDKDRNIFTYMYIPNLVFDSLISVTASFDYQYTYYIGGKGDVINNSVVLKSADKNTFSPTWEKKLLYNALLISGTGVVGSMIIGNDFEFMNGSLDQIQVVSNPTSELTTKITAAWQEKYQTQVMVDTDTNKLYRLNWGQYDKFGVSDVSLIPGSFSFAEIIFVKDGRVNLLTFEDIILRDVIDKSLQPDNAKDLWKIVMKFIENYPELAIILLVIVIITAMVVMINFAPVIGLVAQFTSGVMNLMFMLLSKPIFWILAIIGGFGYYISTML